MNANNWLKEIGDELPHRCVLYVALNQCLYFLKFISFRIYFILLWVVQIKSCLITEVSMVDKEKKNDSMCSQVLEIGGSSSVILQEPELLLTSINSNHYIVFHFCLPSPLILALKLYIWKKLFSFFFPPLIVMENKWASGHTTSCFCNVTS